jgi:hypothetical protein
MSHWSCGGSFRSQGGSPWARGDGLTGVAEANYGAVETHPGALEARLGVMEAHPGAVLIFVQNRFTKSLLSLISLNYNKYVV